MRFSHIFSLLIVALACTTAHAQSRLGVDGLFAYPVGDLEDIVKQGGGLGVYYCYIVNPNVEIRADAAYLAFASKTLTVGDPVNAEVESSLGLIPIRAGANYLFGRENARARFYAGFLVGAYITTFEVQQERGPGESETNTRFGVAPELGVVIPFYRGKNKLDIGVSYDIWFGDDTAVKSDATLSFVRLDIGVSFVWGTTLD